MMAQDSKSGCKLTTVEKQLVVAELMQLAELAVNKFLKEAAKERAYESEKIQKDGYKKEYSVLYSKDMIFALAILRLAYIHTSDMTYTTLMYRDANHCLSYDGAGL